MPTDNCGFSLSPTAWAELGLLSGTTICDSADFHLGGFSSQHRSSPYIVTWWFGEPSLWSFFYHNQSWHVEGSVTWICVYIYAHCIASIILLSYHLQISTGCKSFHIQQSKKYAMTPSKEKIQCIGSRCCRGCVTRKAKFVCSKRYDLPSSLVSIGLRAASRSWDLEEASWRPYLFTDVEFAMFACWWAISCLIPYFHMIWFAGMFEWIMGSVGMSSSTYWARVEKSRGMQSRIQTSDGSTSQMVPRQESASEDTQTAM